MSYLLNHFLESHTQQNPSRILSIHDSEKKTYGEIDALANQFAHTLISLGVKRGDRVALLVENSSSYIAAYYGILKAGGVTVAIYTTTTTKTLSFVLNDCSVKVLITQKQHLKLVQELNDKLPELCGLVVTDDNPLEIDLSLPTVQRSDVEHFSSGRPDIHQIDLDLASIVYTSGSTGDPRGAMLSHLNLVANTRSITQYLKLTTSDRIMVVLPFPYVYGKSLLNTHIAAGGSAVLDNRFVFPNVVLKSMQEHEATGFSGVPSTYAILLGKSSVRKMEFPSLRYITQAGGAMAPVLIRDVIDVFKGKSLYIMYGATEAGARLCYLPPEKVSEKIGSIGKAIPNVEVSIIKNDGTEAQPGETGEIVARGSNIMRGYWKQKEETSSVLTKHGFHTGDLGRVDEDGFIFVVGRKRDMIKSGANRVSAKEIEETILEHPTVLEAAAIGIPDQYLGEAIQAHIVQRPECTETNYDKIRDDIIAFCREKLPEFKVPRIIIVEENLPKNASGKIMKEVLRKQATASEDR